jgi:hypothetical protein
MLAALMSISYLSNLFSSTILGVDALSTEYRAHAKFKLLVLNISAVPRTALLQTSKFSIFRTALLRRMSSNLLRRPIVG